MRYVVVAYLLMANYVIFNAMEHEDIKKIATNQAITTEDCDFVLSQLGLCEPNNSLEKTYETLTQFFKERGIKDYTDAAHYGRTNTNGIVDNPDVFNKRMSELFKPSKQDIVPVKGKEYQALVLCTSGIDVFMQSLAFLARLTKQHGVQCNKIYALIGKHEHRQDLMNEEYLIQLPMFFKEDFNLCTYDTQKALLIIREALEKKAWLHKDGMELAWNLLACDPHMQALREKFDFYDGGVEHYKEQHSLRTDELIGEFKKQHTERSIGFMANRLLAPKLKAMVDKHFSADDNVDTLVAMHVDESIEGILFNDGKSPQQRAAAMLFNLYRILEAMFENNATR